MMIKQIATVSLDLKPQTMWVVHAPHAGKFLVGDETRSYALPQNNPGVATALISDARGACNLPIPAALYDDFAATPWHGFRFLDRAAYETAEADLLRTIVFGPDYALPVLHPAANVVLALRSGSMQLLRQTSGGFERLDQTKTRGKAALAFAAHPSEPLIVYGDNYGLFHAHQIGPEKFGKAAKIADKQRKASRVEFSGDGRLLFVGGMGYLTAFSYVDGKFAATSHELPIPLRDFHWHDERHLVLVNQGMHGLAAYGYDPAGAAGGFAKLADAMPSAGPVNQTAVSSDGRLAAATIQSSQTVNVYAIE